MTYYPKQICPDCGSSHIKTQERYNYKLKCWVTLYTCKDCHYMWKHNHN